jgi:hypothetical protein
MSFRCLSAGGLRFLDHPVPAGEFGLPCGRLTDRMGLPFQQTPSGLPRSTPARTNRGGRLLYCGSLVSSRFRNAKKRLTGNWIVTCLCSNIADSAGCGDPHLRSLSEDSLVFARPVFPWPDYRRIRLAESWALIRASHPAVTSDAWRIRGWALDTSPEILFTRKVRPRVARVHLGYTR